MQANLTSCTGRRIEQSCNSQDSRGRGCLGGIFTLHLHKCTGNSTSWSQSTHDNTYSGGGQKHRSLTKQNWGPHGSQGTEYQQQRHIQKQRMARISTMEKLQGRVERPMHYFWGGEHEGACMAMHTNQGIHIYSLEQRGDMAGDQVVQGKER